MRSMLTADPAGPGVQQWVLASVPSTSTPRGDYGVHVGVTHLLPGAATDDIQHEVTEVVVVVRGALDTWIDGVHSTIGEGVHFAVAPGAWHRFANPTDEPAAMLFAFGGDPAPMTRTRTPGVRPDVGNAATEET